MSQSSIILSKFFFLSALLILLGSFRLAPLTSEKNKGSHFHATVPFSARLQTSIQILGAGPIAPVRSSGSGIATHLGKTSFFAISTVNFTTQPAQINGTATFTAANGDQFYTSFTGTTMVNGSGEAIGNFEHVITGGTGRFENISGTLTAYSVHVMTAPTGSLRFEGSIDY